MNPTHAARALAALLLAGSTLAAAAAAPAAPDANALVVATLRHWRGASSYTEMTLTVHRPDWQRTSTLVGWTRGDADSLVRFTARPGAAGIATL